MQIKSLIVTLLILMVSMSVFAESSIEKTATKIRNGEISFNEALKKRLITFEEAIEVGLVKEKINASGETEYVLQIEHPFFGVSNILSGYKQIPEFTARTIHGKGLTQDYFKENKLTMVNVWGTFCSPCIAEMKSLDTLNSKYRDRGFAVLGIITDGEEESDLAKMIIEKKGVKFKNISANRELKNTLLKNVDFVPVSFFVDNEGNIVGELIPGSLSEEEFEVIIVKALSSIG